MLRGFRCVEIFLKLGPLTVGIVDDARIPSSEGITLY